MRPLRMKSPAGAFVSKMTSAPERVSGISPRLGRVTYALIALSVFGVSAAYGQTRLYTIGNSYSDHVVGIPAVSLSLGWPIDFGRHMIPGAGLTFIWNNPSVGITEQGPYPQALPGKAWDFVTLQPWDEPLGVATASAGQFAALLFDQNPTARVLILATSSFTKLPNSPAGAFSAAFESQPATNLGSRAFFEGLVDNLRGAFPGRTIALAPIQHVMAELDHRLANGEVIPEVATISDVLDGTGHFNARGRYLATLTLFSTMFRVPPTGAVRQNFASGYSVSEAFAEYAWDLVWDVVSSEPYAAMNTDGGLPSARFTSTPTRGLAPLDVTFDASTSSDPDGQIATYAWEFSDGTTANGVLVSRQFPEGVHRARLTVTDDDGKSASAIQFVQASPAEQGTISLEAEWAQVGSNWDIVGDANASMGESVTVKPAFNNTSLSAPPDDQPENRIRFVAEIPAAGNYTIFARVSAPTTSDDSFWVRVNGGNPFVWNNIGSGTAAYIWSQVPGTFALPAGSVTLDFFYRENGTVLDKIQLAATTAAPTGYGLPGVNRTYDESPPTPPTGLAASELRVSGFMLNWQASSDNIAVTGYEILRDGNLYAQAAAPPLVVSGLTPSTISTFRIRAYDAEGNRSEPSEPLQVLTLANNPPAAVITANQTVGDVPLTVQFSGTASSDPDPGDVVIGYRWDFGSGPEGASVNEISKTFTTPGRHTVTLTVNDLFGGESSTSVQIIVRDPLALPQWRQQYFGTTANVGPAADHADPNANSIANFIEFALGRDPVSANPVPALEITNGTLRFSPAHDWLDYKIETSTDLIHWETYGYPFSTHNGVVEVPLPDPLADSQFFRLRVRVP
ncbi:MAG: hypothetical protein Fur0032_05680 [Terrimicrobiaceae bacterium]